MREIIKDVGDLVNYPGLNISKGDIKRRKRSIEIERHPFSLDLDGKIGGIEYGSFMGRNQRASLKQEERDGAEQRELTDKFNKKMGIAD